MNLGVSRNVKITDLEKLNIYLGNVCHENCNETFFLSKVTGYLFFKRMPKLEITLYHDGDPKCKLQPTQSKLANLFFDLLYHSAPALQVFLQ